MIMMRLLQNFACTVLLGAITLSWQPGAVACGYHDDVSLARGVLNWTYPDALHVIGAIGQAVRERRLPAPILGRERDPWAYHHIVRTLDQYAEKLRTSSRSKPSLSFSLLLIEPMLWVRFVSD